MKNVDSWPIVPQLLQLFPNKLLPTLRHLFLERFCIKQPNQHLTADSASLYRNSKAHGGVYCAACHGSPHAVTPTRTQRDNEQAVRLQGHKGPIDQCTLCHLEKPDGKFQHKLK